MRVGFYDAKKHRMVEVEPWTESMELARLTSAHLTGLWRSGRHKLPSPVWCVWDPQGECSIFLLDEVSRKTEFFDQVEALLK